jgi:hypothetical protein
MPSASRAAAARSTAANSKMVWALTSHRPGFDLREDRPVLRLTNAESIAPAAPERRPRGRSAPAAPLKVPTPADPIRGAMERGFAAAVEQHMHGAVLRCSDRAALLRAADRMHLDRFRANLIIALVQRAAGRGQSSSDAMGLASMAGTIAVPFDGENRPARMIGWVTLAALLEVALAAAAWHLWT